MFSCGVMSRVLLSTHLILYKMCGNSVIVRFYKHYRFTYCTTVLSSAKKQRRHFLNDFFFFFFCNSNTRTTHRLMTKHSKHCTTLTEYIKGYTFLIIHIPQLNETCGPVGCSYLVQCTSSYT